MEVPSSGSCRGWTSPLGLVVGSPRLRALLGHRYANGVTPRTYRQGVTRMDNDGRQQSLRLVCGCNPRAVLARVRGVNPGPRQVHVELALDGDWIGDWRHEMWEVIADLGGAPTRDDWRAFVRTGRRPSVDGWSVRCRRASCSRVVGGHIDDLVALVETALVSGQRTVELTSETIAAARSGGRRPVHDSSNVHGWT